MQNKDFSQKQSKLEMKSEAIVKEAMDAKRYQLHDFFSWLANRVYNGSQPEYPSNVLDVVAYIISTDGVEEPLRNWKIGIPDNILQLAYKGMFEEADEKFAEYYRQKKETEILEK